MCGGVFRSNDPLDECHASAFCHALYAGQEFFSAPSIAKGRCDIKIVKKGDPFRVKARKREVHSSEANGASFKKIRVLSSALLPRRELQKEVAISDLVKLL